jgi:beta-lactamase class A
MKALFKITIVLALILPSLMNQVQANQLSLNENITSRERSNWKAENMKISSQGEIEFNEDYTDVIGISDDGYLKISMVSFGMKRKLYFRSQE